jgi:hypothetical protein
MRCLFEEWCSSKLHVKLKFLLHREQYATVIKTNWQMVSREVIGLTVKALKIHKYIMCAKCQENLFVKNCYI